MLGDLISKEVLKTFNNLLNRGKPTVRSNGVKEWTVLASIVTIDGDDVEPICLSTGVKTLPEKFRSYSKGLMVHDSHAETLSFRLLNWVLLDECEKIEDGGSSKLVEKSGELFKWKEGKKLALFVTEPPCGDASMSYITDELEDKTPWNKEELEPVLKKQKVVRGRNSIDKLGVVRTKPGRTDSLISLSKSCSDKICMKQFTGLTNSVTSVSFPLEYF